MKKRVLAGVLACMMLFGALACAEETVDAAERIEHLMSHGKRAAFSCSGDLVKLRTAPGANKMNGRLIVGDTFTIFDTFGEWVRVEVVEKMPDNEEARRGMTGWIHVEHVACECDLIAEAIEAALAELEAAEADAAQ